MDKGGHGAVEQNIIRVCGGKTADARYDEFKVSMLCNRRPSHERCRFSVRVEHYY